MKRYMLLLLAGLCALVRVQASPITPGAGDSLRISLLTCGPGTEVYQYYGHTALRCQNLSKGQDLVFNYGLFDFRAPHFVWRFVLGQTDYLLGVEDFASFARNYRDENRWVEEQELNLDAAQKQQLWAALEENYKPLNRKYRYNFLFDNCSTRPRDKIEAVLGGTLQYAEDLDSPMEGSTFRSVLHLFSLHDPWYTLGIDMLLGSPADRTVTRRQLMFIPFFLQQYAQEAQVSDTLKGWQPLVMANATLVEARPQVRAMGLWDTFNPFRTFLLLFIVVGILSVVGLKKRKTFWVLDVLLFFAAGVAGCIIAFMMLFSEHPAMNPNYLILLFHPFHLLALPWLVGRLRRPRRSRYAVAVTLVTLLFIVLWGVWPQKFNIAVLPLACILLVRGMCHLVLTYSKK